MTDHHNVAQLRPFMVGTAAICLIAAVVWLRFRVDGKIGEDGRELVLSPSQFLTDSIVPLSLANACAIFGLEFFFLGAPLTEFAIFAMGTLFVDFALILPRGLQFWSAYERQGEL